MAPTNLLDTRTTSFGELFSNGKIYRVPPFQRDYSWKEENWEDLWQDILTLHHNISVSHYMGAIVLQSSHTPDNNLTIIDGQQRLATLSIIAVAIIEKIKQLVEKKVEPDANKERQEILKRQYLGDKDPRSLRYSSKLILNENNNDFYQSNLVNFRRPINIRSLSKSNQLLWQAFDYFYRQLENLPEVINDGEKLATLITDTVGQRMLFIQITVEDELNAYTVFETLNARGLELTSTDLLKNYLFSLFRGPDDLQEAQRQWRRIINTVGMEKFPEFLRFYLSLKYARVRRERLFKLVRESVKNPTESFDLLDRIENFSSLFVALGNPNDEFWRDTPQNQPYIRELNLFGVKQVYPTLFAAYQKFSAEDFTRLLKLVAVISFRYSIVSGLNPNELESVYNSVAIDIETGKLTNTRSVFDAIRSVYVKDEKFQQDFSLLSLSTKGQKRKVVRYILCKLEEDASGIQIEEDSFTIEHILPEKPTDEWGQKFKDAEIDEMVYRLGNLTLLEDFLNREIGQKNYHTKRDKYQQSVYALTKKITAEEWTPDAIVFRQKQLAKRAIHIWKSDFI